MVQTIDQPAEITKQSKEGFPNPIYQPKNIQEVWLKAEVQGKQKAEQMILMSFWDKQMISKQQFPFWYLLTNY